MNDKWTMFKNYMHNEVGVSKDDIRTWIKESVQIEAEKMIKQTFGTYDTKKILYDLVRQYARSNYSTNINRDIEKLVADALVEQLTISMKEV